MWEGLPRSALSCTYGSGGYVDGARRTLLLDLDTGLWRARVNGGVGKYLVIMGFMPGPFVRRV